jgi:hypothetical protein
MLGTLAKWLRILGYDTFYASNEMTDDSLMEIAKREKRILITRDKDLIFRAKKQLMPTVEIKETDLIKQIRKVIKENKIDENKFLSRCSVCNTELRSISKKLVEGKVPPKVFETKEKFWYCPTCNRYYWMGSHYDDMIKRIKKINI